MEKKEVKMTPVKGAKKVAERPEKMSYEQLENVAAQLSDQNRKLTQRFESVANIYNRLEFLFKVIENFEKFNPEFSKRCATEIETIITIPEQTQQAEDSAQKKD